MKKGQRRGHTIFAGPTLTGVVAGDDEAESEAMMVELTVGVMLGDFFPPRATLAASSWDKHHTERMIIETLRLFRRELSFLNFPPLSAERSSLSSSEAAAEASESSNILIERERPRRYQLEFKVERNNSYRADTSLFGLLFPKSA